MAQPDLGKRRHRGLGHAKLSPFRSTHGGDPSQASRESRLASDSSPAVGMTVLRRSPATRDGPPPRAETAHRGIVTMARTG